VPSAVSATRDATEGAWDGVVGEEELVETFGAKSTTVQFKVTSTSDAAAAKVSSQVHTLEKNGATLDGVRVPKQNINVVTKKQAPAMAAAKPSTAAEASSGGGVSWVVWLIVGSVLLLALIAGVAGYSLYSQYQAQEEEERRAAEAKQFRQDALRQEASELKASVNSHRDALAVLQQNPAGRGHKIPMLQQQLQQQAARVMAHEQNLRSADMSREAMEMSNLHDEIALMAQSAEEMKPKEPHEMDAELRRCMSDHEALATAVQQAEHQVAHGIITMPQELARANETLSAMDRAAAHHYDCFGGKHKTMRKLEDKYKGRQPLDTEAQRHKKHSLLKDPNSNAPAAAAPPAAPFQTPQQ